MSISLCFKWCKIFKKNRRQCDAIGAWIMNVTFSLWKIAWYFYINVETEVYLLEKQNSYTYGYADRRHIQEESDEPKS